MAASVCVCVRACGRTIIELADSNYRRDFFKSEQPGFRVNGARNLNSVRVKPG
jgi:hypothetical protein